MTGHGKANRRRVCPERKTKKPSQKRQVVVAQAAWSLHQSGGAGRARSPGHPLHHRLVGGRLPAWQPDLLGFAGLQPAAGHRVRLQHLLAVWERKQVVSLSMLMQLFISEVLAKVCVVASLDSEVVDVVSCV